MSTPAVSNSGARQSPADQENHRRVAAVVAEALQRPAVDRPAFVREACAGDGALLAEVESLVAAASSVSGFLESPTARSSKIGTVVLAPERPGVMIGRYKLLEQIGEGGFGVVFMAEQREPVQRRVALKIIKLGMDTKAVVARFEAERQALALMDHPGVAKVLDAGATPNGRPYFVMELVRGDSITRYCDANHLSIPDRLALFADVCRAVQHAHSRGLIHRDIKPSNILVSTIDGRPAPRIIDFGIAKATMTRLTEQTVFTEFRQFLGTPEYMSPEQAEGGLDIDTRTDVYSLGVLLYELLTGSTPLDGTRLRSAAYAEMQRIIREVDPPRPSTKLSQQAQTLASVAATRQIEPRRLGTLMRGELDWIVMKSLEKNRARRYDTAIALADDVERYRTGRAVMAAPPSRAYQLRKFVRRHRVIVATAVLVGLAVLLGLVGTGLGLLKAQQERDRARAAERAQAELREAAEAAATQAETVAGFLADTLRGVGPAVAQGRDTTVLREILDETTARLERGELKNEPAAEAELRHVLGVIFSDMREDDRAIALHRSAMDARIRVAGPDSRAATESMNDLAVALWRVKRYPEAEALMRRVLDSRRRTLASDHPDIAIALNNLGMLLKARGDLDGAETLLREAMAMREKLFGKSSKQYINVAANIATLLIARKDFAAAEPLAREAVELGRSVQGARHPDYAQSLNTLAKVREGLEDYEGAEALWRESLDIAHAIHQPGHPAIRDALECLGVNLQHRAGRSAAQEAAALLDQSLAISRGRGAGDAEQTSRIMHELGKSLIDAGRAADAVRVLEECLAERQRLYPDDHSMTWQRYTTMGLLADALAAQPVSTDVPERAEQLAVQAAEWALAHHHPGRPDSLSRVRECAERLVRFYEAQAAASPANAAALTEKATRWRERLERAASGLGTEKP